MLPPALARVPFWHPTEMRENGGDAALIVGAEAVDGRACRSSLSKRMQGGMVEKKERGPSQGAAAVKFQRK